MAERFPELASDASETIVFPRTPDELKRRVGTFGRLNPQNTLGLPLLLAGAFFLSLYYGRRGFLPLDQGIVFDGAYRIVSGQVPYRDFFTPQALVSILIQAFWFKLLGVSWFSYCVGAGVLNAVFAIIAYRILRLLRVTPWIALLFAAGSAILFYPPTGTPWMVQDAFLFISVSLWAVFEAFGSIRKSSRAAFGLVAGAALVLSFFCKQIPGAFGFPLIIFAAWLIGGGRAVPVLLWAAAGGIAVVAVGVVVGLRLGIDFRHLAVFVFLMPLQLGANRVGSGMSLALPPWERFCLIPAQWALVSYGSVQLIVSVAAIRASRLLQTRRGLAFLFLSAVLLETGVIACGAGVICVRSTGRLRAEAALSGIVSISVLAAAMYARRNEKFNLSAGPVAVSAGTGGQRDAETLPSAGPDQTATLRGDRAFQMIILAELLLLACQVTSTLINNNAANGAKFVLLSAGLVYASLQGDEFHVATLLRTKPARWGMALILATTCIDCVSFDILVNRSRHVIDFGRLPRTDRSGSQVSPVMSFMWWDIPAHYRETVGAGSTEDYAQVVEFLRNSGTNFAFFGDSTVMSAMTGRPSVSPALFYHDGLGFPRPGPDAEWFQQLFINRLIQYRCRYFVIEGKQTLMRATVASLPTLDAFVLAHAKSDFKIGGFRIIELKL